MRKKWNLVVLSIVFVVFLASMSIVYSGDQYEIDTLRGLKGVYVVIEELPGSIEGKGGLTESQIRTDVEVKLRIAGIKVVSKEETSLIPGTPALHVTIGGVKAKTATIFAIGIRVELVQDLSLNRNPKIQLRAATWGKGTIGITGEGSLAEIRSTLKNYIDEFVNDYLSVNPKGGK